MGQAADISVRVVFKRDPDPWKFHLLVGTTALGHRFDKGVDCVCEPTVEVIPHKGNNVRLLLHNGIGNGTGR